MTQWPADQVERRSVSDLVPYAPIDITQLNFGSDTKVISALAVTVSSTALFVAVASPAFAQDSAPQSSAVEEATGADAIIVTGTRRNDRTVLESAVPVDVFSADDFKAQPAPQFLALKSN